MSTDTDWDNSIAQGVQGKDMYTVQLATFSNSSLILITVGVDRLRFEILAWWVFARLSKELDSTQPVDFW